MTSKVSLGGSEKRDLFCIDAMGADPCQTCLRVGAMWAGVGPRDPESGQPGDQSGKRCR